jgi:hypothetical protein
MAVMISHINLADSAAEIAATREAENLGVRNLLTQPVAEVWRVPAVAAGVATVLDVALAAPAEIGVFALFAPRDSYLPDAYTVQLSASLLAAGGTDVIDGSAEQLSLRANRGAWWHWPAAPVTARFIRLRFVAGEGAEFLQFGRLWIGPDWRPEGRAPQVDGFSRARADSGQVERAALSGVPSASPGRVYRTPRFTLPMLSDAEADALEDIADAAGTTRQLVIQPRSERGAKDLVLGRFTAIPDPRAMSPVHYAPEIAYAED